MEVLRGGQPPAKTPAPPFTEMIHHDKGEHKEMEVGIVLGTWVFF
jgi:hypothetical protein